MAVISINKLDARKVLNLREWALEEVERVNIKTEAEWDYSRIKQIGGTYFYRSPLDKIENEPTYIDFPIEIISDEDGYIKGKINDEYVYVRGIKVTFEECENAISDDIKNVIEYLDSIDLKPLEKYLSIICETPITLEKQIDEKNECIKLRSNNIVEHAGVCKLMLSELYIQTSLGLYIDAKGEQQVYVSTINFQYEHSHGGHNGYEIGRVCYDIKTGIWTGLNPETKTYEVI